MNVTNIATRCLDYPNITVADAPTTAPGAARWILDSIYKALGEMRQTAPKLFEHEKGVVLYAPQDTTISVTAGVTVSINDSGAAMRSNFCTARISTGTCDVQLFDKDVSGNARISPAHTGTQGSDLDSTIWHDAYEIGGADWTETGEIVTVHGIPIPRVSGIEQAIAYHMQTTNATAQRNAQGTPRFWWTDTYKGAIYLRVYPMPEEDTPLSVQMRSVAGTIAEADVYTSTETFNLAITHRREILLPLVIDHFRSSPLFNNRTAEDRVIAAAKEARAKLAELAEKVESLPPWGMRAVTAFEDNRHNSYP